MKRINIILLASVALSSTNLTKSASMEQCTATSATPTLTLEQKLESVKTTIKAFTESLNSLEGLPEGQEISERQRWSYIQAPLFGLMKTINTKFNTSLSAQTGAFLAADPVPLKYNPETKTLDGVIVIRRPDTGQLALAGGFHDYGETVAQTAVREAQEETVVDINPNTLRFVGVFDDPARDKRQHVISVAYTGLTTDTPQKTIEAREVFVMSKAEIEATKSNDWFAYDHRDMALKAFDIFEKEGSDMIAALK